MSFLFMREIRTFPLVIEQCAMGRKAFDDLPIKMVILRSYVELPESSWNKNMGIYNGDMMGR